jgi:TPR repeat protein
MDIDGLRRKAEAGSVVAQTILGICYLDGLDVEQDYHAAFQLLSSASKHGVSRARVNLARMYREGLGIRRNFAQAIQLYEAAAKAGEFLAQIELARIYSRGVSVTPDLDSARRWYQAAVAQEQTIGSCPELVEARAFLSKSQSADG